MFERILRLAVILGILAALYIGYWRLRRGSGSDPDGPPPWRDTRVLVVAAQVAAIGLIWSAADYLWANFRARTEAIGLDLDADEAQRVVDAVKEREHLGYLYEAAGGSFELLARSAVGWDQAFYELESYRVYVENRHDEVIAEATVKVIVDGERIAAVSRPAFM